jgi:hypothetical protein
MGLKGSKSMFIFFSFPSSVNTVPVYTTRPLGGTCSRARGRREGRAREGGKAVNDDAVLVQGQAKTRQRQ